MTEPLDGLAPEELRRLGSIVANICASGAKLDRREAKDCNPDLAAALDSVFAGLDAWSAPNPSSLPLSEFSRSVDSLVEPGTADPENLCPGFLVIPAMDSRLVSGFRLVKRIGSGGSGVVYQAQLPSEVHGQPDVALKLLRRGDRLDVSQRVRDAQILKGLDHPNLVRVYAAGESIGLGPFVATEFVEGSNLGDWLDANGPLDEREAAEVVRTLALALNAAHGRGIVHCDVTPRNVFGCLQTLNPSRLKIGDFGLSRFVPSDVGTATGSRDTGGTVGYMAPEQYWGKPSHRSDLYALGAMLIRLTAPRKADFLSDEQARTLHSLCGWSAFPLDAGERRRQVYEAFHDLGLCEPADAVRDPQLRDPREVHGLRARRPVRDRRPAGGGPHRVDRASADTACVLCLPAAGTVAHVDRSLPRAREF